MVSTRFGRFGPCVLGLGALIGFAGFSAGWAGDPGADIAIVGAWARATPPGASVGAVYMALKNRAGRPDRLIAVQSPLAAKCEIHATRMDAGMMSMRAVDAIDLPPGKTINIEPGGVHIMLTGLRAPLVPGQRVPVTLEFTHHAPIEIEVPVREQP